MMKQSTKENSAWVRGRSEYATAEIRIGFPEALNLFHALAGLCVAWSWTALHGILAGIGASLGGCAIGFTVGFLITHLPKELNVTTKRIRPKHRLLCVLFAIVGHLVWLGLGVAFWWFGVNVLCR
jgi:hypothetical protein